MAYSSNAESDHELAEFWRRGLQLKGPLLAYPLEAGQSICGVLVVNDPGLTIAHKERLSQFINDLATAVTMVVLERNLIQRDKLLQLILGTQTAFVNAFADELWFLHELAFRLKDIRALPCAQSTAHREEEQRTTPSSRESWLWVTQTLKMITNAYPTRESKGDWPIMYLRVSPSWFRTWQKTLAGEVDNRLPTARSWVHVEVFSSFHSETD